MKIGMFTSGYQRNPLEHCFQDAKEYGYDYIELWGGRPSARKHSARTPWPISSCVLTWPKKWAPPSC